MKDSAQTISSGFDHQAFLSSINNLPGVYRMLDKQLQVIYVGKAKDLKKRLSSYFRTSGLSPKTVSLVSHIRSIEVINTRTESEALILENDLIKNLNPRYNILFRDDKSYPYIQLTRHAYPRLKIYRGVTNSSKGQFFGPFPSAGAIRYSVQHLQRIFKLRNCEDSMYKNRSRPCLQYQIKRCTAPCVGLVSAEQYQLQIRQAELFLKGQNEKLISDQIEMMEQSSAKLEFEKAAEYRDNIEQLRKVNEKQFVTGFNSNIDIIACALQQEVSCIQVFMIRNGTSLGNRAFFIRTRLETSSAEIIETFLIQHYSRHPIPGEILVNEALENQQLLEHTLSGIALSKISIKSSVRGKRKHALQMALKNAEESLGRHLVSASNLNKRYQALIEVLSLTEAPHKMECFDISHTMGEATKASCVVFGQEGAVKSEYRLYNIRDIQHGDDYAAMRQVLTRRYDKLKEQPALLPDLIFIDGGKGQLHSALDILEGLEIFELKPGLRVIGIAKGPSRRAGYESILDENYNDMNIPLDSPALLLIQQIRDEAHRFAITGHRKARAKARTTSRLEDIPGIGSKRRQMLLQKFGGLQGVKSAGIEELIQIKGINRETAQVIYDNFHG
ncbi:MAG: excinuclease ABC subunit UvrC [Gammaproteobacteria bacterium]|nr:excinuclease ABC subunit UvrC [Gammaproteobacteria bacterium]MBL6999978.1 excinuclease ABC subunit UvrC [Gammaproteobacteria bacterium]